MLTLIGQTNHLGHTVYIFDARSYVAAMANTLRDGGVESEKDYKNCKVVHNDIDNIHEVRKSYNKLMEGCIDEYNPNKKTERPNEFGLLNVLQTSKWIPKLRSILIASLNVVEKIDENNNVLIHCSDGWDRTAQMCATAQLILDPYYRTLEGFEVLIEKDFISFGHKFEERTSQFVDRDNKKVQDERSQVFVQWLDCVHQIMRQNPMEFQFNEKLLVFLANEVYTCRFGTFLENNEYNKALNQVKVTTVSIWTHVNGELDEYLNPFYKPNTSKRLNFSIENNDLVLWRGYFLQYHESINDEQANMMRDLIEKSEAINTTGTHYPLELDESYVKV